MNKIKIISIMLAAMLLGGCTAAVSNEPEPTPAPTRMTVISASDDFSHAVEEYEGIEVQLSAADNLEDADFDVALVYMPDPGILSATTGCEVV
ncbi:MAG: hypothetical protein IKK12_01785, partial [Clostridia bacterium]|nr:hypothetical protein [Clostridia bacterium]